MGNGGYFELELRNGDEYHIGAKRLNTGRNALEYVLRSKKYSKIYLPFFSCEVMLEPILKLELDYEYYSIDSSFYPILDFSKVKKDEALVYINYFGICNKQVKFAIANCDNIIIDNSQAFFSKNVQDIDTFYSPRKFFGVPDGAYLFTNRDINIELEQDISMDRVDHLIGRIEKGAEIFYPIFRKNNQALNNQPIKIMSKLTQKILQNIDYESIIKKRLSNFMYINNVLSESNKLKINLNNDDIPMVYPYMTDKKGTRELLIQNKIFVAQYWPNVLQSNMNQAVEMKFARDLINIPIDQRIEDCHLEKILKIILS